MTSEERRVAEQAAVTLQSLKQAAADAPVGQGMNRLETVVYDGRREHLLQMMSLARVSRRPGWWNSAPMARARCEFD